MGRIGQAIPDFASIDVRKAWTGTFGKAGLTAAIHDEPRIVTGGTHPDYGNFIEAEGVILDDVGVERGTFGRTLFERPNGTRWVKHDNLYIDKDFHKTGFATRFNEHAEELYRSWGVSEVVVSASFAGSYVWARRGFDFVVSAEGAAEQQVARARMAAEMVVAAHKKERISDAELAALEPRLFRDDRTIGAETLDSAPDLAYLPGDLGERILKSSGGWRGVKLLQ